MKRTLLAIACATASLTAVAAPETYTLDPVHTFTYFSVEHLGLSNQMGRFNKNAGKITVDRAAKTASLDITIDTASVDTGDADKGARARSRDEHLRSGDFFNTAEFPRITYKSTKVAFNGDAPTSVEGSLTMNGATHPVALTIDRFKCNAAQGTRKERCGGNATAKVKRSDFGMKYGVPGIGDDVTLMIVFEGDKD
jgi:polyisoprenoid-binding protein YceI